MIASTVLLTFVGWGVTTLFVEPRFSGKGPEDGGARPGADVRLSEHGQDRQGGPSLRRPGSPGCRAREAGVGQAMSTSNHVCFGTPTIRRSTLWSKSVVEGLSLMGVIPHAGGQQK